MFTIFKSVFENLFFFKKTYYWGWCHVRSSLTYRPKQINVYKKPVLLEIRRSKSFTIYIEIRPICQISQNLHSELKYCTCMYVLYRISYFLEWCITYGGGSKTCKYSIFSMIQLSPAEFSLPPGSSSPLRWWGYYHLSICDFALGKTTRRTFL